MSVSRPATCAASSAATFFRFTAPRYTAPQCHQCLRYYSTSNVFRQSSKRRLQTATAYSPSTPHTQPSLRNVDVPDKSMGGVIPEVNRQSHLTGQYAGKPPSSPSTMPNTITTAGESQKPKPTQTPQTIETTTKPAQRPTRFKFKAKKAAVTLTPAAVEQLRELLNQPDPKLIRIGTKNKGCSGLAYHLEYIETPGRFDEVVEQDGVKVVIDSKALINVLGTEMDWAEDKLSRRFVFKNPNITEQCGCGESFSVA